MSRVMQKKTTQKLIFQTLTGATFGAAGTFLFLRFGGEVADFEDPSRLAAAAIGVIYVLMGLFVGVGALAPGAGAKFLNVEDADEILAERKSIGPGAIGALLIGLMLMALALTPGGDQPGALSSDTALAIAAKRETAAAATRKPTVTNAASALKKPVTWRPISRSVE